MSESKININTATEETLTQLPGIAHSLASRIVQYRENVHPFEEIIELAAVPGISEKMVRRFEDQITVENGLVFPVEAVPADFEEMGEALPEDLEQDHIAEPTEDAVVLDAAGMEEPELGEAEPLQDDPQPLVVYDLAVETAADDTDTTELDETAVEESEPAEVIAAAVEADFTGVDAEEIETTDGQEELEETPPSLSEVDADEPFEPLESSWELGEPTSEVEEMVEPLTEESDIEEYAWAEPDTAAESFVDGQEAAPEMASSAAWTEPAATPAWAPSPLVEDAPSYASEPAAAVARPGIDWRTVLISALLGAGFAILGLVLLNGGLLFESRTSAGELRNTIENQAATIQTLESQLQQVTTAVDAVSVDSETQFTDLSADLTTLDDSVSSVTTTLSETTAQMATLQEANSALQETNAALAETDKALGERIDVVAGSTEEFDNFLTNLRDVLIGLKGLPEATETGDAEPESGSEAAPAATPLSVVTATPSPAPTEGSSGSGRATRTPRPTPTPLAIPTQSP